MSAYNAPINHFADRYGWIKHDGETFGVQEIFDRDLQLTTSFIKGFGEGMALSKGGYWTSRVTVQNRPNKKNKNQTVSMFFYAALDASSGVSDNIVEPSFEDPQDPGRITGISGMTSALGKFKLSFVIDKDSATKVQQFFYTVVNSKGPEQFTNDILQRLRLYSSDEKGGKRNSKNNIIGLDPNYNGKDPANFVALQVNFKLPFTLDVVYHLEDLEDNSSQEWLMNDEYTERLNDKTAAYDERFEDTFSLKEKGFEDKAIQFAKATLR